VPGFRAVNWLTNGGRTLAKLGSAHMTIEPDVNCGLTVGLGLPPPVHPPRTATRRNTCAVILERALIRLPYLAEAATPTLLPMFECRNCGRANPEGYRFCSWCGATLAAGCPNCGAETLAGSRFCGVCGFALVDGAVASISRDSATIGAGAPALQAPAPAAAERRLVSVLFADLVGFTSLSEARDAEEVRE